MVTPKFSAPPGDETMRQTPTVSEVQERARGPLSPCQFCLPYFHAMCIKIGMVIEDLEHVLAPLKLLWSSCVEVW